MWINLKNINLGFLPLIISDKDDKKVNEQIEDKYKHGGGWMPFKGFTLNLDRNNISKATLDYPKDPPLSALAYIKVRDELAILFDYSWICVVQKDNSFEVSRID